LLWEVRMIKLIALVILLLLLGGCAHDGLDSRRGAIQDQIDAGGYVDELDAAIGAELPDLSQDECAPTKECR
jgi:hypothetical protein